MRRDTSICLTLLLSLISVIWSGETISACVVTQLNVTSSNCTQNGYDGSVAVYHCLPGTDVSYEAVVDDASQIKTYTWQVDTFSNVTSSAQFSRPLEKTGRHVAKAIIECNNGSKHSKRVFPTMLFTVTAIPTGGGSIQAAAGIEDGIDCSEGSGGSQCTESYEQNAESLKVAPDAGFVFTGGRVNNVLFGTDDFITKVSDDSGALVTLEPEFEPQLELQSVTFFGPDFIKVVQDDGSDYPTPQWERTNPSPSPVGYVRDSRMVVEVTLQAVAAISDGPVYIKGDGPDGMEFPVVQDTLNGGAVTAALQSDILPDYVEYWDSSEFQVTWFYARNADGPWYEAGTSQNQLYVTLGPPKTSLMNPSPVYHTLIHLGSKNARVENSESLVVDKIWDEFTDRNVRRMDGEQLRYYHDWKHTPDDFHPPTTTAGLLKEADGDCAGWAKFFIDMLEVQGISSGHREVVEKDYPRIGGKNYEHGFVVKEWEFIGPGMSPDTAPYVYTAELDAFPLSPNVNHGQAQGNNDPPYQFFTHYIVTYGDLYYDPSYGTGPFADAQQWENMSIDGTDYHPVEGGWYIKKNDLAVTEIKFRSQPLW